jgi:hypothetical protein
MEHPLTTAVLRSSPWRAVPVTHQHVEHYRLQLDPRRTPFVAGAVGAEDHWLEIPLGHGWIAAYRLAHRGPAERRRTHILELRVFPDERDHDAGEWSGLFLGTHATTRTPFAFERVRRGVTEKGFNAALAATRQVAEQAGALARLGAPARRQAGSRVEGRGAGRPPKYPRVFFARLALEYHRIEHLSRKEPGKSTRQILADRHDKPVTTIAKWLWRARRFGFLTKEGKGARGSYATEAAKTLYEQERKRK